MRIITIKRHGIVVPEQRLVHEAAWPHIREAAGQRSARRFDAWHLDGTPAAQLQTEEIEDCW